MVAPAITPGGECPGSGGVPRARCVSRPTATTAHGFLGSGRQLCDPSRLRPIGQGHCRITAQHPRADGPHLRAPVGHSHRARLAHRVPSASSPVALPGEPRAPAPGAPATCPAGGTRTPGETTHWAVAGIAGRRRGCAGSPRPRRPADEYPRGRPLPERGRKRNRSPHIAWSCRHRYRSVLRSFANKSHRLGDGAKSSRQFDQAPRRQSPGGGAALMPDPWRHRADSSDESTRRIRTPATPSRNSCASA